MFVWHYALPVYFITVLLLMSRLSCHAEECGKRPPLRVPRVIGGHEAIPNTWPWLAEIQYNREGEWYHACGGSLIHPEWIVTAAHCLTVHSNRRLRIILGEHDRTKAEGMEQYFDISQCCIHKRFDLKVSYGYDIAVVRLSRPAILNRAVSLVCLPKQNDRVEVGKLCYLTGWGIYKRGGPRAEKLQEVQMPTVNYSICDEGNSAFKSVDNESMLCGGFGGKSNVSGCNGDSGGPLVCQEGGKFVLRGVVNWGIPGCPAGKTFSVFARVSWFVDWIENHIKNSDLCSCPTSSGGIKLTSACTLQIMMLGFAYALK